MSTGLFGHYHGTTSIDLIWTSCWCQIANIIWTSTHKINMMPRMCQENDHWQQNLVKNNVGWNFVYVDVQCQFNANSDVNLMSTVDVTKFFILMSIQHFLPTGFVCGPYYPHNKGSFGCCRRLSSHHATYRTLYYNSVTTR